MKSKILMMTIAAVVLGLSGAASAEIVTVAYMGTVELITDNGGLPPVSEGETLVATYTFNLPNAMTTDIGPTGGFSFGSYGSFVTTSLTINGTAAVLPTFATGQINGETQVEGTGSVLDSEVTAANPQTHLMTLADGMDFSWNLGAPTNISFTPGNDDEAVTQFATAGGDFLEADVSNVTVTVSSSSPVPEPSTWAMMVVGFAGFGLIAYRRGRGAASRAV
jgi:PEP-CTERM motif